MWEYENRRYNFTKIHFKSYIIDSFPRKVNYETKDFEEAYQNCATYLIVSETLNPTQMVKTYR